MNTKDQFNNSTARLWRKLLPTGSILLLMAVSIAYYRRGTVTDSSCWQEALMFPFMFYTLSGFACLLIGGLAFVDCIGRKGQQKNAQVTMREILLAVSISILPGIFLWITMSLFFVSWSGTSGLGDVAGIAGSFSLLAAAFCLGYAVRLLFK